MPQQPLTLKQRLASLSQSVSGDSTLLLQSDSRTPTRTSNFGALGSAIAKQKARFNPPWSVPRLKRDAENKELRLDSDFQRVDEVLGRVIFQAGVDFETRPMVIMNASGFPDQRSISYDLLLSRILSYLDLFVESDYTVVFFAAGGNHTPSWNWVWKAYRGLSRKYRKNLKRLYIVHSSFFSKMLFSLAGAIISPKFFQKITYIDTLSELACHVPLTQIDIPPAVYSENLKYESEITLPAPTHSRMFGVMLEDLMGYDGEKDSLPRVVRDCIQYIRETGLEEEGLFRRSPNSVQLHQVREAYDRGQVVSLHNFGDPHLAAVLLKKFLRDLPEPIFTENTYDTIKRCPIPQDDRCDMAMILYLRSTLLPQLTPCKLILLSNVLLLLHEVSLRSDVNRMDAHNLAIVITPNLVASGDPLKDVSMCAVSGAPEPLSPGMRGAPPTPGASLADGRTTLGTIIKMCIHRYFEIFDEIVDRTEAIEGEPFSVGGPDGTEGTSSSSSSPYSPSSPNATKRQSLLHDDDSLDDAVLVMPIGPNGNSSPTTSRLPGSNYGTYVPRVRPLMGYGDARSITSNEHRRRSGTASLGGTMSRTKARSLFAPTDRDSSDNRHTPLPTSASAGVTLRKSSGAGVSARSVTASGFFTPPPGLSSSVRKEQNGNAEPEARSGSPLPPPPLHPKSSMRRNE